MKKHMEWLKTFKGKEILGICLAILLAVFVINLSYKNKKDEPILIFKENIVVEYGQKSFIEDDETEEKSDTSSKRETLPVLMPEELIQKDVSKYDELSFNKIAVGGEPVTLEFRFIDTSTIGSHEGIIYARHGKNVKEFNFTYEVLDTRYPVIEGENQVKLKHDEAFDLNLYNAYDIIDGDLEITVDGMKDEAGTFDITLKATDKNKNTTQKTVTVTREEAPSVAATSSDKSNHEVVSNESDDSNNSYYASSEDSYTEANYSSQTNENYEVSHAQEGPSQIESNNAEKTQYLEVVEMVDTMPRPNPLDETPPGMIFYKDYGNVDSCIMVADEVLFSSTGENWRSNYCDPWGFMYYSTR